MAVSKAWHGHGGNGIGVANMGRPSETRDVLVVLLPRPRDLDIVREAGWYRVRSIEMAERIKGGLKQFKHLAFYQPDSFRSEARCVRHYAPISRFSKVRRLDLLPDEPSHPRAQDLYLKFDLGELLTLDRPIPADRGRRLLFIPTSWRKIAAAENINDLFSGSHIEENLYRSLREQSLLPEREFYFEARDPTNPSRNGKYFLDFALFCRDRNVDIETDGDTWHARTETIRRDNERDNLLQVNRWHVLRFNTSQIKDSLDTTMDVIREAVNKYGGVIQPDQVVRRFSKDGRLEPGQAQLRFES